MTYETDGQVLTPTTLTLTLGGRDFAIKEQSISKARALAGLAGRIMDKTRLVFRTDEDGDRAIDLAATSQEGMALLPGRAAEFFCDNFNSMKPHRAFITNDPRVSGEDLMREFFNTVGYLADPFGLKVKVETPEPSTEAQTPTGGANSTEPSPDTGERP